MYIEVVQFIASKKRSTLNSAFRLDLLKGSPLETLFHSITDDQNLPLGSFKVEWEELDRI